MRVRFTHIQVVLLQHEVSKTTFPWKAFPLESHITAIIWTRGIHVLRILCYKKANGAGTLLHCTYPTKNYLNKTIISMAIEEGIYEVKVFRTPIELLSKVTFRETMMRTGIGRVSCCVYCKHEMGNLVMLLLRSKWSLCIINSQAELLNNNIMTWTVSILTWWVVLPPTLLTTLSRKWES